MAEPTVTVEVKLAWWLKPYLYLLVWFCVLHGCVPDQVKLQRVINRAIRLSVRNA